jgi:hypothetical protein
MKRFIVGVTSLAITGLALAAGPGAVRKQVEASMLLTGTIVVAPDGSVKSYELDKAEKIPANITALVSNATQQWHFDPVMRDGQAVTAKARMSLRVVAKHETPDSSDYTARISGATFGDYDAASTDQITYIERNPPVYPQVAARGHVGGTVYVLLRIGRDGKVVDAEAEQVNLNIVSSDAEMKAWRKVLASPSVSAARHWTFHIPTTGLHANDPYYVTRVPIVYRTERTSPDAEYATWQAYVPGPKDRVSWADDESAAGGGTDALPDGQIQLVGTGLKLTTPVSKG